MIENSSPPTRTFSQLVCPWPLVDDAMTAPLRTFTRFSPSGPTLAANSVPRSMMAPFGMMTVKPLPWGATEATRLPDFKEMRSPATSSKVAGPSTVTLSPALKSNRTRPCSRRTSPLPSFTPGSGPLSSNPHTAPSEPPRTASLAKGRAPVTPSPPPQTGFRPTPPDCFSESD